VPEDLSVARVDIRVELGGHNVPEGKIRARYERLWGYIASAISLSDEARVYDNSRAADPFRVVAELASGRLVGPSSWPSWTPAALTAPWT
jgi:predicted ABC-type ATPase